MEIISLRIKFQERETNHSLPSNAEVKSVDLCLYSAIHIHGVMINKADSVKEDTR
jgi:hypothetical protein